MIDNIYTSPLSYFRDYIQQTATKCIWVCTAFSITKPEEIFDKVFQIKRIASNKTRRRTIHSSVCVCSNLSQYDCTKCNLGSIFPGQTLQVISGIIIVGFVYIHEMVRPFKSRFKNVQEILMFLNLLVVYVAAVHNDGNYNGKVMQMFVIAAFIYFFLYISCHCAMLNCANSINYCVLIIKNKFKLTKSVQHCKKEAAMSFSSN